MNKRRLALTADRPLSLTIWLAGAHGKTTQQTETKALPDADEIGFIHIVREEMRWIS